MVAAQEGTARGQLDTARVVRFQEHGGGVKKLKCGGLSEGLSAPGRRRRRRGVLRVLQACDTNG